MRVVVTGGRDYAGRTFLYGVLDALPITELACGGADGADYLAWEWAGERGIPRTDFPAKWHTFGRAAGPKRNREMLDTFKPDAVIAFPGGRGTADCIRAATERGIPIHDFTTTG